MSLKLQGLMIYFISLSVASCFNISPTPNIVFKKPEEHTFANSSKPSYFGYSLTLRKNSILIGAPRSLSCSGLQESVNEPGAVFKCSLSDESSCYRYNIDPNRDDYSTVKNNQLLGWSMDGLESEKDSFMTCAPKQKKERHEYYLLEDYLLHGRCFEISETSKDQPNRPNPIKFANGSKFFYSAECGFSVHVVDHKVFLIGCPGVDKLAGSFNVYNTRTGGFNYFSFKERDMYFGFAVTSAKFNGYDTFYVTSAPRSNGFIGEVFIFEKRVLTTTNNFTGTQIGEYFGYAVLAEDFNGDGLPDLAISAPFHQLNGYENGAVYIYLNRGNMVFDLQVILTTNYELSGRFGTTLGMIGDINQDGYNDIAISAPFERNGAVYIYLGGPEGLSTKHSQRIQAPSEAQIPYAGYEKETAMFGHGISRGVDIDGNGYHDIAIGSPNSESVYIFKTYPSVKVISKIETSKKVLYLNETNLSIRVCSKSKVLGTNELLTNLANTIELSFNFTLDPKYNRVFFADSSKKFRQEIIRVSSRQNCEKFLLKIDPITDPTKPIDIEMMFENKNHIPEDSKEFCKSCFALDPRLPRIFSTKVSFNTGCKKETCLSDLKLKRKLHFEEPFIIGSEKSIVISYEISNTGEPAFVTQLTINIPLNVTQFSKVPQACTLDYNNQDMVCKLNYEKPITNDKNVVFEISLDTSRLVGDSFVVFANVSSASDEKTPDDNINDDKIPLIEISNVELIGKTSKIQYELDENVRGEKMSYDYKISNYGPSNINGFLVKIQIPTSYISDFKKHVKLLDVTKVEVKALYGNKILEVKWNEQDDFYLSNKEISVETQNNTEKEDQILNNLSKDRTITLDCSNPGENVKCSEAEFIIQNFKSGVETINIILTFVFDLSEIDKHFNFFVIKTASKLEKNDLQTSGNMTIVSMKNPLTILYKKDEVNVWIYILAFLAGILMLGVASYVLFKIGFFDRKKKEELKRLTTNMIEESFEEDGLDDIELENKFHDELKTKVNTLKSK